MYLKIGLLLAALSFCATQSSQAQSACRMADSLTLVTLHTELTFNWDLTQPMTSWTGVSLNSNGCVASLTASPVGGILPEQIGDLAELTYLDFSESDLAGRLPGGLTSLTNLEYLNLSQNDLEGALPTDIASLSNLEYLDLSDNHFENSIPAGLWELSNLTYLSINSNPMLAGVLPPEISNLTNLEHLSISGTTLLGTLPPEIGSLSSLKDLYLEKNKLFGEIPTEIGNLTNLVRLQLGHNGFTGNIPVSIMNLTNLQVLYVNSNVLSGVVSDFSGMASLNTLAIGDNQFTYSGLEENLGIPAFSYAPQDSVMMTLDDDILTVDAGQAGQFGMNTYNWYRGEVLIAVTTGDNTLQVTESGIYRCKVLNSPITKPDVFGKDLILISHAVYFDEFRGAVFPGDINHDGTANIADVLPWGLAYGSTGEVRLNATAFWEPQEAIDWTLQVGNINGKYIDCNGDGTIDESDIDIIMNNYEQSYPYQAATVFPTTAQLYARYADLEVYADSFAISLDIILEETAGADVDAHGASFEVAYREVIGDAIEHLYTMPNTDNSWMGTTGNDLMAIRHDMAGEARTDIAITRNDGQNASGAGVICTLRMVLAKGADLPEEFSMDIKNASLIDTNGKAFQMEDAQLTIFGLQNIGQTSELVYSINSTSASCSTQGSAEAIIINEGTTPYTYEWSNGESTARIEGLEPGVYDLILTDATGLIVEGITSVQGSLPISITPNITHTAEDLSNGSIELNIGGGDGTYTIAWEDGQTEALLEDLSIGAYSVVIADASGCTETFDFFIGEAPVPFNLKVLMQGAYDAGTQLMRDDLREKNLLPMVDPYWNTVEAPPVAMMNTGDDAIVDWLLIQLRDDVDLERKQAEKIVFIQRDGDIVDIDGVSTPEFEGILHGLYNLVILHRNHLPAMSPAPFLLNEGGLVYDFSQQNSYTGAAGFGQIELTPGTWAMYGGDGDQNFEIAGSDKNLWTYINGIFSIYDPADYDLNGEANGSDKSIWFNNNGISSRVPKVE